AQPRSSRIGAVNGGALNTAPKLVEPATASMDTEPRPELMASGTKPTRITGSPAATKSISSLPATSASPADTKLIEPKAAESNWYEPYDMVMLSSAAFAPRKAEKSKI